MYTIIIIIVYMYIPDWKWHAYTDGMPMVQGLSALPI